MIFNKWKLRKNYLKLSHKNIPSYRKKIISSYLMLTRNGNQALRFENFFQLFHDGGPYPMETSPLICYENQWTDFYMIGTSILKELKLRMLSNLPGRDLGPLALFHINYG